MFKSILDSSRVNNLRDDITGVLVFDRLYFIQILEGQRHLIWSAFQRIQLDGRHGEIQLVELVACGPRQFTNWSMAGSLRTPIQEDVYSKHGFNGRIQSHELSSDRLIPLFHEIISLSALTINGINST
ncbi:BLUF domain-containing protein [Bosea sp. PAMC 26642]|uniref:BLUF domain-containing protein n=1 Tax=Bosea sp. (strain PAMC 26642) TaxID=1792307 RepID=UPI003FA4724F